MSLEKEQILNKIDFEYGRLKLCLSNLYDKYKFEDIVQVQKKLLADYNCLKTKTEEKSVKTINYFHHYEIYSKIYEFENNFVSNTSYSKSGNIILIDNGQRWIRIVGANKNRIDNSDDVDFYGNFSILETLEKFKDLAERSNYLPNGLIPQLLVMFYDLPNEQTCQQIENLGIKVTSIQHLPISQIQNSIFNIIKTCNIDTTSLITLVSEICYADDDFELNDKTINMIKRLEFKNLNGIKNNKNLLYRKIMSFERVIVCESAWKMFLYLVQTYGGNNEQERLHEFEKYMEVVPDITFPRFESLYKVKESDKIVFSVGEKYNACTITGNYGFVKKSPIFVISEIFQSISLTEKMIQKI